MLKTEYFIKGYILFITILIFSLLVGYLEKLQVKTELEQRVEKIEKRNEVITQQLQEMNRYVKYPGG